MRERGYYWVRDESGEWEPYYWDGAWWYMHVVCERFSELDMIGCVIGPKLEPPTPFIVDISKRSIV